MQYIHYSFYSEMLCIGERIKKGTFRPTATTIPYTQITGALKAHFGGDNIHAVGHIINYKSKDYLTYSPQDRMINSSKIPISIEFMVNVTGSIYVVKNEEVKNFPDRIEIMMGALRTKGLGHTILKKTEIIDVDEKQLDLGDLNTRIPLEHLDKFLVTPIKPKYGYLIKPLSLSNAVYVKSLFEGSEVYAPKFLLYKR